MSDPNSYVSNFTNSLINDAYGQAFGFALQAFQNSMTLANQVVNTEISELPVHSRFIISPGNNLQRAEIQRPEIPDVQLSAGLLDQLPEEPDTVKVDHPLLSDIPAFTQVAPTLEYSNKPTALTLSQPSQPTLETVGLEGQPGEPDLDQVTLPSVPSIEIPSAPTLRSIDVPVLSGITIPTFTAIKPLFDVEEPDIDFIFNEPAHDVTLYNTIKSRLESMMASGDALPEAIEQLLLDKGRAQADLAARKAFIEIDELYARAGWGRLTGPRLAAQAKVIAENTATIAATSKDLLIGIHQGRLTIRIQAVAQGIQAIIAVWGHEDQVANRALQASKTAVEIAINLFNARITLANTELGAWAKEAEVYRELLQAELAKLEIYKAKLQGQQLIGTLNEQDLKAYTVQLEGVKALIDVFNSQVASVEAIARNNQAKVQNFATLTDAWAKGIETKSGLNEQRTRLFSEALRGLQIQADTNKIQWDAWSTEVGAEGKKVDIYQAATSAYNSLVEATKVRNEAIILPERFKLEVNEGAIKVFAALVDRSKALIQADTERIGHAYKGFEGLARIYESDQSAESARLNSVAKSIELQIAEGTASSEAYLKGIQLQITQLMQIQELILKSKEQAAQAFSQIAAGVGGLFNFGASVSSGSQTTTDFNYNMTP